MTVYAPAKVNLVLEVLGRLGDYHRISTIVQTIGLCDVLTFEPDSDICFKCDARGLEHDNLVTRAAELLKACTGCGLGAIIELRKRIPWSVGLGGGSSDAAATLVALNELWRLGLPTRELVDLGAKLGSDVPFFIYGGTALVEGRGEILTPLPSLPSTHFVLLVPPLPKIAGKTGRMYARLSSAHFTEGWFVQQGVAALTRGEAIDHAGMFNTFETVAFDLLAELDGYRKALQEGGALAVHLAGSGPCLFTFYSAKDGAAELVSQLKAQGFECYVAASCSGYDIVEGSQA